MESSRTLIRSERELRGERYGQANGRGINAAVSSFCVCHSDHHRSDSTLTTARPSVATRRRVGSQAPPRSRVRAGAANAARPDGAGASGTYSQPMRPPLRPHRRSVATSVSTSALAIGVGLGGFEKRRADGMVRVAVAGHPDHARWRRSGRRSIGAGRRPPASSRVRPGTPVRSGGSGDDSALASRHCTGRSICSRTLRPARRTVRFEGCSN